MPRSQVILLNGVSSSGKTSIAKALQKRLDAPYLHVCIDSFEEMMPDQFTREGDFSQSIVFGKMLSGFHYALAAMGHRGNNMIIDHVLVEGEEPANWLTECLEQLVDFDVLFVGVRCPLEQLAQRERERGDRPAGLAEWQFPRMHRHVAYDLEVNTSIHSPDECADVIKAGQALSSKGGLAATLRLQERAMQAGPNF